MSTPSQFINARETVVTDALSGLVRTAPGIVLLDGFPHVRVVLRDDFDGDRVALVSGGGSGHEPAHAGYVGPGMLAAAVCGDVFASPSVDAVLAGILAVTGAGGCLLIVKNYTGDRLNFGLAAERARAMGHEVEMVIVADDVALPDIAQPRGVAGTLFVHKIAGAMAEDGAPLAEVAAAAREVAAAARSIGMSLTSCHVPGVGTEDRIPVGEAELGLGIHGEPGVMRIAHDGAAGAIAIMAEAILPEVGEGAQVALINNLGGATAIEMAICAGELARGEIGAGVSHVIGPAPMMTALDMRGLSISLLPARPDWVEALSAPVPMAAWPGCAPLADPPPRPLPKGLEPREFEPAPHSGEGTVAEAILRRGCEAMIAAARDLDALDARAGDGDTGATLAAAARALVLAAPRMPMGPPGAMMGAIAQELGQTMGGSSGVLLAIFFSAAGETSLAGGDVPTALRAGLARMREVGGAAPGDRTMIDALAPALEALDAGLPAAAEAARAGAEATAAMDRAGAGRAAYVGPDALRGNVDPGAEAVARLFEALA